jgi:GTP-sensing pleiotropic transcriptional regulator CodY
MMSDLQTNLNQIQSRESFLERIKRHIPGYDGYVNRDNSRELDTLLRNQLAADLTQNKTKIKNAVSNLSKNGKLFETADIDKIDKKNENAIAKFRSAARGYSGAFDVVKIKEEKLNMLYEFDSNLFGYIENISSLFTELENNSAANTDVRDTINKISAALDDLLKKFDEREGLLRSFS